MVLGMISEKMRMSRVITADTRPNHWLPKTCVACWPTPAAPMVLAIVLSDRMAANGRSVEVLYFLNRIAVLSPSSSFMMMNESGVESNEDSRVEQRKEMAIAPNRKAKSSIIANVQKGLLFYQPPPTSGFREVH